jgi:hypothetical protein
VDVKRCSHEGCTNLARKGGVCVTHGAKVKRCSFDGCINKAVKGGVCVTHGAKRKQCSHEGYKNGLIKGGVCITHGAKKIVAISRGVPTSCERRSLSRTWSKGEKMQS